MTHLQTLKTLTANLPPFPPCTFNEDNYKEYAMPGGGIMRMWDLLWIPQISVTKFFVSKGSKFQEHKHDGRETIYVTSGRMTVYLEGRSVEVLPKKPFYILPGVVHSSTYKEDTWGIVVCVPAESEYASKSRT